MGRIAPAWRYKIGYAIRQPGPHHRVRAPPRPRHLALADHPRPRQLLPRGHALGHQPQQRRRRGQQDPRVLAEARPDAVRLPDRATGSSRTCGCSRSAAATCGPGRLFIDYLDSGNYYGTDISPDILLAAQRTVVEYGLQRKLPYLTLVQRPAAGLPARRPLRRRARAQRLLALAAVGDRRVPGHVGRIMAPGGLLRLHLRPDRGHRAPGAARRLLLPDARP